MPSRSPPNDWKNHHGTPFCAGSTAVSPVKQLAEPRRERGDAVGLERDDDDVGVGDRGEVVGGRRLRREVAAGREHAHAVALQRLELRAARDQHDVGAAARSAAPT